ncbi:MAG: hypothetical protein K0S22_122 [Oscillospiraceae bacterium]|jgi:hypothetical protein|nr:hypothetical protein [Oscillospiraceae bacterium]
MENKTMKPEITEALCELLFQTAKEMPLLPVCEVALLSELLKLLQQLRDTQLDMQQTLEELANVQLAKEVVAQDNIAWLEAKMREETANLHRDIWPFTTLPEEL